MRLIVTALLLVGLRGSACQICLPFPTASIADHLLDSGNVVLAREDPGKPFHLASVAVLKEGPSRPPLSLFLDSQTRRSLASNPDHAIICVWRESGDVPGWARVATNTPRFAPILRDILASRERWAGRPSERPRYFVPFLGSDDPQLATLAHLEIARAPYSEIRELATTVPIADVRAFLADFRMIEWHALYILLLARSADPADHARIIEAANSQARFSLNLQTAAWMTAYIEIRQGDALDFLDEHYIANADRRIDEAKAALSALSVHGNSGHTHLRDRIIESYRQAVTVHPETAALVTADLAKWERPDLADAVGDLLRERSELFDVQTTLQLRRYLRVAEGDVQPVLREPDNPGWMLWGLGALVLLPVGLKALGGRKHRTRGQALR